MNYFLSTLTLVSLISLSGCGNVGNTVEVPIGWNVNTDDQTDDAFSTPHGQAGDLTYDAKIEQTRRELKSLESRLGSTDRRLQQQGEILSLAKDAIVDHDEAIRELEKSNSMNNVWLTTISLCLIVVVILLAASLPN